MSESSEGPIHWRWSEHEGARVFELDLRGCSGAEATRRQREASRIIKSQPERSLLCLTLAHGVRYDPRHVRELAASMQGNEPFVIASAVVGLDHLTRLVNILNHLSGRRVKAFERVEDAKVWLATQKSGN